jgi:hypothetical protein
MIKATQPQSAVKTMKVTILVALASAIICTHADNREALSAIRAKPKCDPTVVHEAMNATPLNEEIVLTSLIAGCAAPISDQAKLRSWSESDNGIHSVTVAAKYQTYFNKDLVAPLQSKINAGGHLDDSDLDAESAGFGLEFIKTVQSQRCGGANRPAACAQLDPSKSEKQLVALLTNNQKGAGRSDQKDILGEACPMLDELRYHESVITNEKDAAKVSGVVDKQKMYESGKVIAHHKRELVALEAAYKRKTGQKLILNKCPAKFQQ